MWTYVFEKQEVEVDSLSMERGSLFLQSGSVEDWGKDKTFSTKIMGRGWLAVRSEWGLPGAQ